MSTTVEIRCEHCDEWFRSPIGFGRITRRRIAKTLEGNLANLGQAPRLTGFNSDQHLQPYSNDLRI